MLTAIILIVLLIVAVSAIYLILKNMGEEGIEIAAPGSCKSGRCGVRCRTATETDHDQDGEHSDKDGEPDSNLR